LSPRTQIQSVHRAATVLELVAGNGGMRASQIATRLDVPLPTVFHLLSTLTDVGLLDKLDDRRYQLGPMTGLLAEAYAAQVSAPEHLHARLQEMAERTGETAYLSVWRRGDATLLSIVEGRRAVRVSGLHLGYSGATHARASGKVLLTFSGPTALDEYLEHHELTNPSTTPKALRAVIERTRRDGYAVDEEEFAEGVSCVAAPVTDGRMAMGVSAPSERFRENREELIELVLEITSKTIQPSSVIGGVR
jgi:DNA-binding IclR family transcriptional regulator